MDTSAAEIRDVEKVIRNNPLIISLVEAFQIAAQDEDLLIRFLRDIHTGKELEETAKRWAAARLLLDGKMPAEVARLLGMSFVTIRIVLRCLIGSTVTGGYDRVFQALSQRGATTQIPGAD